MADSSLIPIQKSHASAKLGLHPRGRSPESMPLDPTIKHTLSSLDKAYPYVQHGGLKISGVLLRRCGEIEKMYVDLKSGIRGWDEEF